MATEPTNVTTDSTKTANAQAERSNTKGGGKAAKSKGKGRKPTRAARTRQHRPERDRTASGGAKTMPYRPGSCYQAIIDALRKLGIGKFHDWEKIVSAVELPKGFKTKEKRTDEGL